MNINYKVLVILAVLFSALITSFVIALARYLKLYDRPSESDSGRKRHKIPTPKIGGIAIFIVVIMTILSFIHIDRKIFFLMLGLSIVFLMGLIDDLKNLKPKVKLVAQIIASCLVLAGGIGIVSFGSPFGNDMINLDFWRIPVELFGFNFNILPIANLITIGWIVFIMNAVNLSDGLDGLAGGVSATSALTITALSLQDAGYQSVVVISLSLASAIIGFLVFNLFPAKIFLGDSGAYFIGMLLAVLPIYSNAKLSVGVLVLGFVLVDMILAILARLRQGKSPMLADRKHLHYRLVDSGVDQKIVVIVVNLITVIVACTLVIFGFLPGLVTLVASISVVGLYLFTVSK